MKKRRFSVKMLLAMAVLPAVAGGLIFYYFSSGKREEARIMKVISVLAEDVSKNTSENPAVTLLKLKNSADAFDYPARITFGKDLVREYEREELLSSLTRYRALLKVLKLEYSDHRVELSDSRAVVLLTLHYQFEDKTGAAKQRDVCDVEAEMVKKDKLWKIKSLQFSKILQ